MSPGIGTRSLLSQVFFSAASVVALGAVAKTSPSEALGYAVVVLAVQAVANTMVRGYCVNALLVYRGVPRRHREDAARMAFAVLLASAAMGVVVASASVLLGDVDVSLSFACAVLVWQVMVLVADVVRAYDAFLGSRWGYHVAALVASVLAVALVSGAGASGVVTAISLACIYGALALLLACVVRIADYGGEPVSGRRRMSVAREGFWISAGLSAALLYVASVNPLLGAGWQVVNQLVASPLGYFATAVNASATRRIKRSASSERVWPVSIWVVGLGGLSALGGLVAHESLLAPLARLVVGDVWDSSRALVLPCVAYMLYFQYVSVVAIVQRLGGRDRADLAVLVLSITGALIFAVSASRTGLNLDFFVGLPVACAALAVAVVTRAAKQPSGPS